MRSLLEDLRYGLRSLLRKPGFTAVAIITLAVGIGANSLIFTLANAVLFRPLPVSEPDSVVSLYGVTKSGGRQSRFSWLNYADHRDQNEVFTGLLATMQVPLTLGQAGESEPVLGEVVTGNYFSLLGIKAARGRVFSMADDRPDADRVVVIGYSFWQRRFAGDPTLVNRTIALNGLKFTVIGVADKGFSNTSLGPPNDVWVPVMQAENWLGADWKSNRARNQFRVMGRLKPGISRDQAQAFVSTVAARLASAYPEFNKAEGVALVPSSLIEGNFRRTISSFFALLLIVVALVLLIACANVANLLLVRALGRQRELAVRQALGATRARLVRLFLFESVLLTVLGGIAGTLVAIWASTLLHSFNPLPTFPLHVRPDPRFPRAGWLAGYHPADRDPVGTGPRVAGVET